MLNDERNYEKKKEYTQNFIKKEYTQNFMWFGLMAYVYGENTLE